MRILIIKIKFSENRYYEFNEKLRELSFRLLNQILKMRDVRKNPKN